jgi:exodeoxyribonuclease VII small subunit
MPKEKEGNEDFNFTKFYQEIEEINEWFQGEDIDLDEALEKYERGMMLIQKCKERLKKSENKFEEIKKKYLKEG